MEEETKIENQPSNEIISNADEGGPNLQETQMELFEVENSLKREDVPKGDDQELEKGKDPKFSSPIIHIIDFIQHLLQILLQIYEIIFCIGLVENVLNFLILCYCTTAEYPTGKKIVCILFIFLFSFLLGGNILSIFIWELTKHNWFTISNIGRFYNPFITWWVLLQAKTDRSKKQKIALFWNIIIPLLFFCHIIFFFLSFYFHIVIPYMVTKIIILFVIQGVKYLGIFGIYFYQIYLYYMNLLEFQQVDPFLMSVEITLRYRFPFCLCIFKLLVSIIFIGYFSIIFVLHKVAWYSILMMIVILIILCSLGSVISFPSWFRFICPKCFNKLNYEGGDFFNQFETKRENLVQETKLGNKDKEHHKKDKSDAYFFLFKYVNAICNFLMIFLVIFFFVFWAFCSTRGSVYICQVVHTENYEKICRMSCETEEEINDCLTKCKKENEDIESYIPWDGQSPSGNFSLIEIRKPKSLMCNSEVYNLNLIQLASLAGFSYYKGKDEVLKTYLMNSFFQPNKKKNYSYEILNITQIPNKNVHLIRTDINVVGFSNVTIFAIRGSKNYIDWWLDFQLFSASAFLSVIKWIPLLVRTESETENIVNRFLTIPLNAFNAATLVDKYSKEMFESYEKWENEMKRKGENRSVIFVGHSLGGGLSKLIATKYKSQSVAISGPGITPISYMYSDIQLDKHFKTTFIDIVPDRDLVPRFEVSGGTVFRLVCGLDIKECHLIKNTICMMGLECDKLYYTGDFCSATIKDSKYEKMKDMADVDL